jgi:hypothetical protein
MVPESGKRAKAMRWFKNDVNASIAELIPSPRMDDDLIASQGKSSQNTKSKNKGQISQISCIAFAFARTYRQQR